MEASGKEFGYIKYCGKKCYKVRILLLVQAESNVHIKITICSVELTEMEMRNYFTKVFYNNKINEGHEKWMRHSRRVVEGKGIPEKTNKM